MGDEEPLVDLSLAIQPLPDLCHAHQRSKAVLQHTGTNPSQDVFAAVLLQHDRLDAAQVKQLGQKQPRGAGADDADLGPHCRSHQKPVLVIKGSVCASTRSEEHTSELQSLAYLVCRLLLEKKKKK